MIVRVIYLIILITSSLFSADRIQIDFDSLNLNPLQKEKIGALLQEHYQDAKKLQQKIPLIHQKEKMLFKSEHFELEQFNKLKEEEDRMRRNHSGSLLSAIYPLLNDSQREKFYEMYETSGQW
jgi:hypothetical protein